MAEEWKVPEEYASRIPLGEYKGISSKLILEREAVVIIKGGTAPKSTRRIPYGKIRAVKLLHTNNYINTEYMLIQGEGYNDPPLRKSYQWAAHPSVITFTYFTTVFFQLFHLLKILTPPDTEFEMINGGKPADIPVDLAPYFEAYTPSREMAARELKKKERIKLAKAIALVDAYFDTRQEALYAEDPEAVFRDLHCAVRGISNSEEQREREREQIAKGRKVPEKYASRIPLGKYVEFTHTLVLERDAVVVVKRTLFGKLIVRLPYNEIVLVRLVYCGQGNPHLSLCREIRENMPRNQWDCDSDMYTVRCTGKSLFFQIFHLLKLLTPADTVFRIEYNDAAGEQPLELAEYFEKYNPCRTVAAVKLSEDAKIEYEDAAMQINRYFDARQEVLYAEDPELIFRDLDRAIQKVTPEKEEFTKKWVELYQSGKIFCPKCLSEDFEIGERGFDARKSAIAGRIAPGAGIFAGFNGAQDVMFVCRKCGHKWEPK